MISILIPTYNYKVDTLVAILYKQAEKLSIPFEILVYDDGSTQFTSENKSVDSHKHVRYHCFQNNAGRGAIRHQLALDATADHVLFLDADVIPTGEDFLSNYEKHIGTGSDVICGGIAYREQLEPNKELRHVYGKSREAKSAIERQKEPYIIVTANVMMRKSVFLAINTEHDNVYGEDLLLSQNLKYTKAAVLHIDNPVWHLGLESAEDYLRKSKEALNSMIRWEKEGRLETNFTSLQRTYRKMKRLGLAPLFRLFMKICNSIFVRSNLVSKNPSLFWFDLYRLQYYSQLQRNA